MPYPSEHAARLVAPERFEQGSFRRKNNAYSIGIHAVYAKLKGEGELTLQAIRFDADKITPEEAKKWLKENKHKPLMFEQASKGEKMSAFSAKIKDGKVEVPREALTFTLHDFAISDKNGEGAKSAPCTLKARSGQPIQHWYWGNVVHDLAGMRLEKKRVAIDWNHDPDEIIGYLNHFDISSGDLMASGALVPYKENDRATEIIFKAAQGVPYEASISFPGGDQAIETVGEDEEVEVNGQKFTGPGVIFREWTLRGVAICPYGADHRTSTDLADEATSFSVRVLNPSNLSEGEIEEITMDAETEKVVDAVETAEDVAEQAETKEEGAEVVEAKTAEQLRAEEGQRFMDAFGSEGAMMFAKGMTFDAARDQFTATLKTENAELKTKVAEMEERLASFANRGEAAVTASVEVPAENFMDKVAQIRTEKGLDLSSAMSLAARQYPDLYRAQRSGK
jgi:hypothetical protein